MAEILDETTRWLKDQHSVCAPNDWLEQCIDWIISENGNQTSRDRNNLRNLVLEQWLVSDLKEIGAQCLSRNLLQEKKCMLNGSFCLQINSVVDVGSSSYYSQLQKVQGTENENVHVSATQYNKDEDTKSGRMLKMDLTDGTTDLKAIEYKPIRELSINTKLGTKVIISGEVLCRLGVLMLSGNNVKVIGGEVDSLVTSQEEMLKQALQLKERFKQDPLNKQYKGQGKKYENSSKGRGSSNNGWNSVATPGFGKQYQSEFLQEQQQQQTQEVQDAMAVDWGDDMDDLLLKHSEPESEKSKSVHHPIKQEQRKENITKPSHQKNISQPRLNLGAKQTSQHFMDDDDFDVDELEQLEKVIKVENQDFVSSAASSGASYVASEVQRDDRCFIGGQKEPEVQNVKLERRNVQQEYYKDEDTGAVFKYLLEVKDLLKSAAKQRVRIKAYIGTLSGKLDYNGGRSWSLPLQINDGTSVMKASVSDSVLCHLIGFQASDCLHLKQSGTKEERLRISEGIKKCQHKLIEMSCFMDIELGGDLNTPVIVSLTPVDSVDRKLFL